MAWSEPGPVIRSATCALVARSRSRLEITKAVPNRTSPPSVRPTNIAALRIDRARASSSSIDFPPSSPRRARSARRASTSRPSTRASEFAAGTGPDDARHAASRARNKARAREDRRGKRRRIGLDPRMTRAIGIGRGGGAVGSARRRERPFHVGLGAVLDGDRPQEAAPAEPGGLERPLADLGDHGLERTATGGGRVLLEEGRGGGPGPGSEPVPA